LIATTRGFGLLAIALLLVGCASKDLCRPAPYTKAEAPPPIVVPDGLDAPDRRMALRIPSQQSVPGSPDPHPVGCIAEPPAYFVDAGQANPESLPVRPSTVAAPAPGTPPAAPTRVTRDVTRFVEQWAADWSRRDFDAWVQHYEPDFTPEGYESNAAWRTEQQRLFQIPATTRVDLDSMQVNLLPEGKVRVRFVQHFGLADEERSVRKELVLASRVRGTGWLIAEDYVDEIL
jgi:hypothetical protein